MAKKQCKQINMQARINAISTDGTIPEIITVNAFGKSEIYHFQGVGAYPYDCIRKDEDPQALIYYCQELSTWLVDTDLIKTDTPNVFNFNVCA